jgi:hypothetical protein
MLDIFRIYPQYSQENAGVVAKTNSRWLSFMYFTVYYPTTYRCVETREQRS